MVANKFFKLFALASVLIASSGYSQTIENLYLEVDIGQSDLDMSINDFSLLNDGSLSNGNLDTRTFAYNIGAGYFLNDYFSIEVGYVNLGEPDASAISDGSGILWSAGGIRLASETTGYTIALEGSYPLGDSIEITGKLGHLGWDSDITLSNAGTTFTVSEDGSDPFFGFGLLYKNGNFDYVLDFTGYEYDLDDTNISFVSVGARYHF
ncbi:MAG: hypothetical protein CMQ38_10475 [Gammaproteobacteria bacterium]|nr:hypothetical protein [Gammaproteobacteria bacterium]|tara:strand:+ start:784 stop:1407 length:624 start_codon:yes stop_codon:yes gene_type:complete